MIAVFVIPFWPHQLCIRIRLQDRQFYQIVVTLEDFFDFSFRLLGTINGPSLYPTIHICFQNMCEYITTFLPPQNSLWDTVYFTPKVSSRIHNRSDLYLFQGFNIGNLLPVTITDISDKNREVIIIGNEVTKFGR